MSTAKFNFLHVNLTELWLDFQYLSKVFQSFLWNIYASIP